MGIAPVYFVWRVDPLTARTVNLDSHTAVAQGGGTNNLRRSIYTLSAPNVDSVLKSRPLVIKASDLVMGLFVEGKVASLHGPRPRPTCRDSNRQL